jgi:hypothetical protein
LLAQLCGALARPSDRALRVDLELEALGQESFDARHHPEGPAAGREHHFDRTGQARLVEGDTVAIRDAFGGLVAKIRSASALILVLAGLPFRVIAPADKLEKIA